MRTISSASSARATRALATASLFVLLGALAGCELETDGVGLGGFTPDTGVATDTTTTPDTTTTTDTGPVGPVSCTMWAGTGTCISTASCGGVTGPASQCATGQTCCYNGALPSCTASGNSGECRYTSACGAGFESERGTCTGPDNVGCCYPEPTIETCEANGVDGVCLPVDECDAVSTPGTCGGGGDVQCCAEVETCEVSGVAGVCIDVEDCDDGRETTSGLCPGDASIRCCHDPVTSTGCNADEFACDNGTCIDKSDVCNRKNECGDYSDEFGCATSGGEDCGNDQLACPDRCVSTGKACNGTEECADGFDEIDCE